MALSPERKKLLNELLEPGAESDRAQLVFAELKGTKEDIAFLKAFRAGEGKKRRAYQRTHLIEAADQDIANHEALLKKPKPAPARAVAVEVVTDNNAMDLATIQQGIAAEQEIIDNHMDAAKEAMLPHALRIGLYCLQAQNLLALPNDGSRSQGKNQHSKELLSEADKSSDSDQPGSFSAWISTEVKDVSRANAYNYLRAVQGLGLDHTATAQQLTIAIKKARKAEEGGKLSIAKLAHRAPKAKAPAKPPKNPAEVKAGEARVFLAKWKEEWERGVKAGHLEDLDAPGLAELDEFLRNVLDHVKLRRKSTKAPKAA